jgi:cell division protein FtsW
MGFERFGDGYHFLKHQVLFGLIPGIIGCLIAYSIPYVWYKRFAPFLLVGSIVLLILVFIPGVGAEFGTSRSWIHIGGIVFQPSEIVKLTFLLYICAWLSSRSGGALAQVRSGFLPFLTMVGVVALLLMLEPDTGTMAIIAIMAIGVYLYAGAPWWHGLVLTVAGSLLLALLFVVSPYRAARFTTFLHPELDPQGIGYHVNQALLAVGSGGMFGRGWGHSVQKYQYLPEVAGDSIFAVMSEELGFLLTSMCILVYLGFLLQGIAIAQDARDPFGSYIAVGVMIWLGVQALFNIGAMLAILPITGVPLPFMSYGGTALVVSLTAVGVVMNIAKTE